MSWRLGIVCVAATIVALSACEQSEPTGDGAARVVRVIDGDTIDVEIAGRTERVRLIGIDTPETKKPNTPIECYGPEASAFTTSLLPIGTAVRVERDVVGRDDYGRLLGYVYLVDESTTSTPSRDTFVNLEIIRGGFATPLTIGPNSAHARDFADAASAAEAADIGLWAACSG